MSDKSETRPLTNDEWIELKATREQREGSRAAFIENLADQYYTELKKKGELKDISDENLERINYHIRKWVEAQDAREKGSNKNEDEAARIKLTEAIKGWQKAAGLRPCGADDCVEIIPADANPRRLYCSKKCQKRAQNKRRYEKDPDAQLKATKKYLDSIDIK